MIFLLPLAILICAVIVFSSYDRLNASIEAKRDIIAYENGIFGWGIY